MSNPLFSIIVSVYNVEQYLVQCVESILIQSFKSYEIILVNDGSTDGSPSICDKYSIKYRNIKTIHKDNGGVSDARNVGIQQAIGDYILFIDSDDFIAENSLQIITNTIAEKPDVDVVFLKAIKYFEDGRKIPLGDGYIKSNITSKSQREVFQHIATLPKYPGSSCTKLVRRNIIVGNNLYYEKGRTAEDLDWCMQLFLKAKSFNFCDFNYYFYRQQRQGSITNSVTLKKVEDLLYVIKKWTKQAQNDFELSDICDFIYSCAAYEYLVFLPLYAQLKLNEKLSIKKEVNSLSWLLQYRSDKRTMSVKLFLKVFGIDFTSSLLRLYLQYR